MSAPDGSATEAHQIAALTSAATHIADLVAAGTEVVITHGNGPQVGNLLVKNELSAAVVPPVSLDWCVAQTQATIGFVLQNALDRALADRGVERRTVTLVTRTLVDAADPAFANPGKPIGRYRTAAEAEVLIAQGQHWADLGDRGWRRVVPSPVPIRVVDAPVGAQLAGLGHIVILAGGGGVPVVDGEHGLVGVEAVIDKDLAAAVLAKDLGADVLVIATDVEAAVLSWGTPQARSLGRVTVAEMTAYQAQGHFAAGSMGPKVAAVTSFVADGGRAGVITRLDRLAEALTRPLGTVGTVITPG
ncbi:carbamate kinase [Nakamurella silvestris]|nr:carbamate kinase [Nakamurella silvestris]